MSRRRRTIHDHARALALVELLIAVTITSVIGVAMAALMTSAARAMSASTGARSGLQRAHAAYTRLRAYTEPALCLLQHDAYGNFAIWLSDSVPGEKVNLTEFRVFWFDVAGETLTVERVALPDSWTQEMKDEYDIQLSPNSDFISLMLDERSRGYTSGMALADGMVGLMLVHTAANDQSAQRFRLTINVSTGPGLSEPILMAFGLPQHQQPK